MQIQFLTLFLYHIIKVKNIMKNLINIWNPNTGNQKVTLTELRELICERRKSALKRFTNLNITILTTDNTIQQVAAHYKSFQIRQFDEKKAIEVFNQGGSQIATKL